jgi:hypothetical protein
MAIKKQPKLVQRQLSVNGHNVYVSLIGDCGCISIEDNNLYPDNDSRMNRRNLNFHSMMIPLMTREQLKDLHIAIGEVLKHSK